MVMANSMDLSLFQFDYGLTWSTFFLNPDKTLYGRYGSRGQADGSKDVSLGGFRKALEGALELHKGYPANKATLTGKKGPPPRFPVPQGYPGLANFPATVTPGDKRNNNTCMHCHEVLAGEYKVYRLARQPIPDSILWTYPMPHLLGLVFDTDERATVKSVTPASSAEKDGFKAGDEILTLEGQPIISIADIQWVLERTKEGAKIKAEVRRGARSQSLTLSVPLGWRRKGDFGWRDSTWSSFRPDMSGEDLTASDRKTLKLTENATGFRLTYVGPGAPGFQKGDIVVEVDGQRTGLASFSLFLAYIAQKKLPGEKISLSVSRGGTEQKLQLTVR
jgi:serine protease Do